MQQPKIVLGNKDYVFLLKRSLYGLEQSLRQWYKRFDSFMISHDFKRSSFDSCVYFNDAMTSHFCIYSSMLMTC